MTRIAVLVSGGGTNLQALIGARNKGKLDGGLLALVVSSKYGVYALERADRAGIATEVIPRREMNADEFDRSLCEVLQRYNIGLVVLAGFLSVLGPETLSRFEGRIINVHPSLIPSFCGPGMYGLKVHEAALKAGVKITGATVHFVNEVVDGGSIILQKAVDVLPGDTPDVLQRRVMENAEWVLLPMAVSMLCGGRNRVLDELENEDQEERRRQMSKKRALISVSDKTGVVEFAKSLTELGYEVVSTGGTAKALNEAGVPNTEVSKLTGFPECLDGRVKTLHPVIHAGILAIRDNPYHMQQLDLLGIQPIDIVAINLYPFKKTIMQEQVSLDEAIENIDIGGPTMIRAAAKNWQDVTVAVDPEDYPTILQKLKYGGSIPRDLKFRLACKVFEHTAAYDALISNYLRAQCDSPPFPDQLTCTYEKAQEMRYGENPHQSAAFYKEIARYDNVLSAAKQLHGKELSYNNINDANGALDLLKEFGNERPCAVAVKHANPCGVGLGGDILEAYKNAYDADPVSIYGGIVALNRQVDAFTARKMSEIFLEIILAPSFAREAVEILAAKKNIRLMELPALDKANLPSMLDMKKVAGGLLVQQLDTALLDGNLQTATRRAPTDEELRELLFAWKVVKHAKSNAIVLAKDERTVGIGPGQTNRITALELAVKYAGDNVKGSVMASDAYFPFSDCVELAAKCGITAIIQPGGSIRDKDSIKACDAAGISMVFTGMRHFKH